MGATNSPAADSRRPSARRVLTVLEVLAVYAAILYFIWRWEFTHPLAWAPLFVFVVLTHFLHHDSLRSLGLSTFELGASAQLIVPLALVIFVPLVIFGLVRGDLVVPKPVLAALASFGSYVLWCCFQQYLAQSFFHHRLMSVVRSRHLSSALVGLMFGAAHIPNPVLMIATGAGGFLLAEVYARHPNIWPLALVQAVAGFLIAAVIPAALIHNMRVGPGYFFYGLH
jgi:hypothetical protein